MVLQFEHLKKQYGDQVLFTDVNLSLEKGEKIGIIGPSGRGKSTLLKIAAGLVRPSAGRAIINTGRIGYVFQEPRLMPWYPAEDNIAMVLHPLGYSAEKAKARARELMGEMGLAGFEAYYPDALSGGMKQRVSICRAMAISPELLLLDEPFTGLDPDLRAAIRERLQKMLTNTKAAVIHVTHDISELMSTNNRLFRLTSRKLNIL